VPPRMSVQGSARTSSGGSVDLEAFIMTPSVSLRSASRVDFDFQYPLGFL
jgi:hypothetical protein